ncbi:DUF4350 domain-containing protein [Polluticoccus soli]|uniref:DUF4350 domain-containing protein n=1 Tax=Polluticoccus soli TaxID=3034150 RepID=UPI0023E226E9|nr:DUF4350 domain-containing protein [Flavipsychrobacter sp. JY13-12]
MLSGCFSDKKKTNWQVTLASDDKNPYGSYLAFQSLALYFPNKLVETLPRGFRYTSIDEGINSQKNQKQLLVLLGLDLFVSESELESLLSFARRGNEVLIFSSTLDPKIEDAFGCYKQARGLEEVKLSDENTGRQNIDALSLKLQTNKTFGYEGRSLQGYFQLKNLPADSVQTDNKLFSTVPDSLGFFKNTPNFIRYNIGRGHIAFHAAPLVMSNYFLLQKNNRQYLDGIWQTIPSDISAIYWNEYFKHSSEGADLGVLWKYPATRWALIIAAITLLIYVAFESKRRQRIIPIIEKPENSSVSFIETVGRLYYNTGDHNNIAEKIIQHFLEWVRLSYHLNTNELNEHFATQLAHKSGLDIDEVQHVVRSIHNIRLRNIGVDEMTLVALHQQLEHFYNNHTNTNGHSRHQSATAY